MAAIRVRYFTAKWCGPCRAFGPALEKVIAGEPGLELVKHDIDDRSNEELLKKYLVQSVPTVIFETNNGSERLGEILGGVSEAVIRSAVFQARERLAALIAPSVPASKVPSVPVELVVKNRAKPKAKTTARRTVRKAKVKARGKARKPASKQARR